MMVDRTGILELEGMEFHSFHGVLEREKAAGNLFVVDFRGILDMRAAAKSDALEDAMDYSKIYDVVAEQMAVPSELLEHVAGRIVEAIAAQFPQLESCSVRVSKRRPPEAGIVQWSRITLTHNGEK